MNEELGHNSITPEIADQLNKVVERVETLAEERATLGEDIKEVYGVARSKGLNTTVIRQVIARRKKGREKVDETDGLIDLYESALARELAS